MAQKKKTRFPHLNLRQLVEDRKAHLIPCRKKRAETGRNGQKRADYVCRPEPVLANKYSVSTSSIQLARQMRRLPAPPQWTNGDGNTSEISSKIV